MLHVSQLAALVLASGAAAAAPCPDKDRGTLEEWKCFGEVEYDVRRNHRTVPPGVTLGEVRRGWKGPCD